MEEIVDVFTSDRRELSIRRQQFRIVDIMDGHRDMLGDGDR